MPDLEVGVPYRSKYAAKAAGNLKSQVGHGELNSSPGRAAIVTTKSAKAGRYLLSCGHEVKRTLDISERQQCPTCDADAIVLRVLTGKKVRSGGRTREAPPR